MKYKQRSTKARITDNESIWIERKKETRLKINKDRKKLSKQERKKGRKHKRNKQYEMKQNNTNGNEREEYTTKHINRK